MIPIELQSQGLQLDCDWTGWDSTRLHHTQLAFKDAECRDWAMEGARGGGSGSGSPKIYLHPVSSYRGPFHSTRTLGLNDAHLGHFGSKFVCKWAFYLAHVSRPSQRWLCCLQLAAEYTIPLCGSSVSISRIPAPQIAFKTRSRRHEQLRKFAIVEIMVV